MAINIPSFKLLSGREIPLIGLGTDKLCGRKVLDALNFALLAGYRLVDTAAMYGNERDIGDALQELLPKHNLKREDVFITSKLHPSDHGDNAKAALAESLDKLQCGYLDLYLIHWPGAYGGISKKYSIKQLRSDSWKVLVEAKHKGLVKDIGVSNYTVKHLTELLDNCYGEKPVVNQIEWHPYCHDDKIKEFCDREGILVQGYMPLGGEGNAKFRNDSDVIKIAKSLKKSWAQVLLRWSVNQNVCVIPKSKTKERLEENIDLNFNISPEDMMILSNSKIFSRVDWDPNGVA